MTKPIVSRFADLPRLNPIVREEHDTWRATIFLLTSEPSEFPDALLVIVDGRGRTIDLLRREDTLSVVGGCIPPLRAAVERLEVFAASHGEIFETEPCPPPSSGPRVTVHGG
jgi:hypothetical protein